MIGHPADHHKIGDGYVDDEGDEVEVDDEEKAEGEDGVQYLSAVDVGGDNPHLPRLNAGNDQRGHGDVEESQQEQHQLDGPGLVQRPHLEHQQDEAPDEVQRGGRETADFDDPQDSWSIIVPGDTFLIKSVLLLRSL